MTLLRDAERYVANLQRRSNAFHAGVIGFLDESERLIAKALVTARGALERPPRRAVAATNELARQAERLRPNWRFP